MGKNFCEFVKVVLKRRYIFRSEMWIEFLSEM